MAQLRVADVWAKAQRDVVANIGTFTRKESAWFAAHPDGIVSGRSYMVESPRVKTDAEYAADAERELDDFLAHRR